jgi:hypothetical protein
MVFENIYGEDRRSRIEDYTVQRAFKDGIDRGCSKCFRNDWDECVCEYKPSEPYNEAEVAEYNKRRDLSRPLVLGRNGNIEVDGKKVDFFGQKNRDFDFTVIQGAFYVEDLNPVRFDNCSFFATNFSKSRFRFVYFMGCDFRYANLDGADFCDSLMGSNCNFYGAKINGSRICISKEQLLTTDPL